MTDERKPGDEGPVEAWDDEGGAAERDETSPGEAPDEAAGDEAAGEAPDEAAGSETADRAKRWADEQTEHWHGARSSDETRGRGGED